MRLLVTGANGYLGQGVVREILESGNSVIATDLEVECIDSRAERVKVNLFELENPFEFYGKPDVILHLAWRNGFIHNSETHIEDLLLHYKFLSKMIESGVKRVCVMGSMHEVGFYEGSINETTCCNPMSLYGISKNALRNIIELQSKEHGIVFQWLRGYYIVGNSKYGNSIFSKLTIAEKKGEVEFPFTTGQNQYDFLDYNDFCKQVAAAVCQDRIDGIINICSGKPEKLADRVERFIRENNYNIKLKYGAFPDRAYDSKAVWGDNSKIQEILNNNKKDI